MSEILPYIHEFIPHLKCAINNNLFESYRDTTFLEKGEYYLKFVDQYILIDPNKKNYVTRELPYVVGFYSDYGVDFDIYINNEFTQHYSLIREKLTILKIHDDPIIHCSKVCPNEDDALEIRNIRTNFITDEIKIVVLGINVNNDKFNELTKKHFDLMKNIKYEL